MNYQSNSKFKSIIEWEKAQKFAKLEYKTDKKGEGYFYGTLNPYFKIMIRRNKFNEEKQEYIMQIIPVTYSKEEKYQSPGDQPKVEHQYGGSVPF